ncbi:MAG: mitochondrial fission ELM1 family protein [Rhizobiales bacterium]|nr:mitochondrial fission ELM1 family protein [Hyphomicrobiales bacterium]
MASEPCTPRIWVLVGSKGGDNAQVLAAADAMGLNYEIRRITMRLEFETAKPAVSASLHHIDRAASDRLEAPWPDVVIAIGRRLSMVALWIKQQSSGACRIALFNAAKGSTKLFDLIIVPAYYNVAENPRICRIGLPLLALDPAKIATARSRFADSIGNMPRPLTVLLLGGGTSTMRLGVTTAQRILEKVRTGQSPGGSLYVSTSRRTAPEIADALQPLLGPGDRLYRWTADPVENPYLGLLAHGDRFVVTGDSISMIVEVARLGRPLAIAELPRVNAFLMKAAGKLGWHDPGEGLISRFIEIGAGRQFRDFDGLYAFLYDRGLAVRLGDTPSRHAEPLPDDTARVAARLRRLAGVE